MGFLGVYRAIYDYAPQGEGELEITEGDLLFVLEKSTDDDWWRAKKKAMSDEDDEPEGLIPNNYIEEAAPVYRAKALYDYAKQTDEEISFAEDAVLDVYDTSDEDWTLVGQNGEFGFAPAIYIEKASDAAASAQAAPPMPARNQAQVPTPEPEDESPPESPARNPAKALASIIAQRTGDAPPAAPSMPAAGPASPPLPSRSQASQYTPEESEDEAPIPRLPQRPPSAIQSPASADFSAPPPPRVQEPPGVVSSPPYNRQVSDHYDENQPSPAGGYHLYNIHEMVSSLGKNKKMPTTLGINLARGLISIAPAKSRDGPQQEWTAERLTHYSIEGKHVFMELVRPSKSIDFHAGAKDTAQEIVAMLGELAGASRAEGLREVMAASSGGSGGQKRGHMLYEFMAQGDDEVTVAVGDEIIVLDDTKSEEWWMVRRLKNGKEGVVPSSYVEVTGTVPQPEPQASSYSGINAGRSTVEQNRLEEERATKDAARRHRKMQSDEFEDPGVGAQLPARQSSLAKGEKRQQKRKKDEAPKAKPNSARVRTWTDRSGAFRVDAEFLGLKDNKIHLHKDNGVKIAVPVSKMAVEDLEYVEKVTGVSLEDDKPLSDIKRRNTPRDKDRAAKKDTNGISTGSKESDYDWFDFFLACNVNPQVCERYAQNFAKDQMGEEILPDVTPALLRTLGLKEGDIIRVMKHLDTKFGRTNGTPTEGEASGGLFSGPSGALKNNTRKGRPAPAIQTNDVVDADAFKGKTDGEGERSATPAAATETPLASAPAPKAGFDDDAWSVKPVKSPAPQAAQAPKAPSPAPTPVSAAPPSAKLTGSMGELSLLSPALEPTPTGIAPQPTQQAPPAAPAAPVQPQEQPKPAADPAFFDKLGAPAAQNILSQPTGRARPTAPALNTTNSMIAPPPRAASAPGFPNQQQPQSAFAPPQPMSAQRTGFQNPMMTGYQAPPGQSLSALQQQQTMMSPYGQQNGLLPQQTGYMPSPQMPGFYQQPLQMQPTASPFADPITRPSTGFQPTPTGMTPSFIPQSQFASPNSMLPPALTPMRTGFAPSPSVPQQQQQQNGFLQPQQTGYQPMPPQQTGFSPFANSSPSFVSQQQLPPQQYMNGSGTRQQAPMQTGFGMGGGAPAPLMPQKTGPAPPVRFGTSPGGLKPLVATPTGRRANLSQATPQNPFGF